MKKIISALLACIMLMLCLTSCAQTKIKGVKISDEATDYVIINVKDYGEILVKLCPDVAPITVQNFKDLVSEGFYDGLIFHRVIKGFMIQGGDPKGDGTGGSDKKIKGEFASNGVENNLSHYRGVISMARGSYSYDSASSQFFICDADSTFLDGNYAAFGYVVYGMDVVDAVASTPIVKYDPVTYQELNRPVTPVQIKSARFATVADDFVEQTK